MARIDRVSKLTSIIERFPAAELALRRLCNADGGFKAVCEDYHEAAAAMRLWDAAGVPARAEEYRAIMAELEAEILEVLDADEVRHAHRAGD